MGDTLHLSVKATYFHLIQSGEKKFEYRSRNPFWAKKLEGKTYNKIVISLGYPPKDDTSRRITFPWCGFERQTITHPHFGNEPHDVYALILKMNNEN